MTRTESRVSRDDVSHSRAGGQKILRSSFIQCLEKNFFSISDTLQGAKLLNLYVIIRVYDNSILMQIKPLISGPARQMLGPL